MKFVGDQNLTTVGEPFVAIPGMAGAFRAGPPYCADCVWGDLLGRKNTKAGGLTGKCLLFERRMRFRGPSFPLARGHCGDHEKAPTP
jgi:hypothetical protein